MSGSIIVVQASFYLFLMLTPQNAFPLHDLDYNEGCFQPPSYLPGTERGDCIFQMVDAEASFKKASVKFFCGIF